MSTAKLRVLALCGFTQNSYIYSRQLGAIRKACKNVEFVFLEPPIIVEKVDMPWNTNLTDFDSSATTGEEEQTPETTPRAWWLSVTDMQQLRRFEETVAYMHDVLVKQGPFDGIMAFSQGASLAAIIAGMVLKPGLHPSFPAEPRIPPFKFIICVGGFIPSSHTPPLHPYFPLSSSLPVLVVIGRNDTLVTPERSQTLIDQCHNVRVEYHDGGHFTPCKASWRHFFNAYISSFGEGGLQGDIGPPSSFGPSGTNSPVAGGNNNSPKTSGNKTPATDYDTPKTTIKAS